MGGTSAENNVRVRAATEAARQAGRDQLAFFERLAQSVQGLRLAPEAGVQGTEGQPCVLIMVEGPESWVGMGRNRHKVAGRASYVLRPNGSMEFVPGKLADASGGSMSLRELREVDAGLAEKAQWAIIADKKKRAKKWRGNPKPGVGYIDL